MRKVNSREMSMAAARVTTARRAIPVMVLCVYLGNYVADHGQMGKSLVKFNKVAEIEPLSALLAGGSLKSLRTMRRVKGAEPT